jgi:hypothetical protein
MLLIGTEFCVKTGEYSVARPAQGSNLFKDINAANHTALLPCSQGITLQSGVQRDGMTSIPILEVENFCPSWVTSLS